MDKLNSTLKALMLYIERENYRGWDPYDALTSPIFRLPILNSSKTIRFATQQFIKRCPFNLRALLFIKKGYNPISLGLCIQGYSYLIQNSEIEKQKDEYINKIEFLITELDKLSSKGYSGYCWGNPFDWEARYARIPAYSPSVVATGFIINALYIYWKISGNQKAKDMITESADFVLKDLNRTYDGQSFCFSYSPVDKQIVYNSNMKGARILAQVYTITKEDKIIQEAKCAINFVVKKQRDDGAWEYSMAKSGKFIDNYHTGYILECLDEYHLHSNDNSYDDNIKRGYEYYINNFFEDDGAPKFYNNKNFPIDCTAAAQSILTLTRFGDKDTALKVANYMIKSMKDKQGYFYFRNYGFIKDKTSFMRWSNAWMFAAISFLMFKVNH